MRAPAGVHPPRAEPRITGVLSGPGALAWHVLTGPGGLARKINAPELGGRLPLTYGLS